MIDKIKAFILSMEDNKQSFYDNIQAASESNQLQSNREEIFFTKAMNYIKVKFFIYFQKIEKIKIYVRKKKFFLVIN